MGQVLHVCAATTAAIRRTIQNSQESLKAMADYFHINVKTVAKWHKRITVEDQPMDPRQPHSTVLTAEQEATIIAFREFGRKTTDLRRKCLNLPENSVKNLAF